MRVSVNRAEVVTGRTPFELLARSENELEELTHNWVFGSYGSKQRIIFKCRYLYDKQSKGWRAQILEQRSGSEGDLRHDPGIWTQFSVCLMISRYCAITQQLTVHPIGDTREYSDLVRACHTMIEPIPQQHLPTGARPNLDAKCPRASSLRQAQSYRSRPRVHVQSPYQ